MSKRETEIPDQGVDRLEALVRERTSELSALVSYLHHAQEEEKRLLARELHDELGSLLTATKLDITFIKSKCAQAAPALVAKCDRVSAMIDQGTALKRRLIDQLRPSTLDMLGLGPAMREMLDRFATQTKLAVDADVDGDITPPGDDALAIYRIVEEALANVRKHAQASRVSVTVERSGKALRVRVRDNGRGFDPAADDASAHGLAVMRQRVAAMGGRLSVESTPGSGTSIDAQLPLALAHPAD